MEVLADGEYDAIVMGTGLKECVISGLLSVNGLKVLHMDRNNYYGGDCASLNLNNLYKKFQAGEVPSYLGANRDYNVDLIPKLIMACGNLTKMLLHTKVTRYLEFKSVSGSYVYRGGRQNKILKVPATPEEESFGLQPETHEFISHAMCLQVDDDHLEQPALPTVQALRCYCHSMERYGTSPYIYPIYGLGGLPEGFSRLCAIHGGTFMLNRDVDEIIYNDAGKACGIRSGNEMARAKMVIGDPSYFPRDKVRPTGQIVRCICFLNHPIPNTQDRDSVQIIIPGSQVGRKNDIYVCCLSNNHAVSARGIYTAIVSTKLENGNPQEEIAPGLALLGQILQRFTAVATTYEPVSDGSVDNCFISSSFDGASHFEQDCDDMLSLYERVTGTKLDMSINADSVESEY